MIFKSNFSPVQSKTIFMVSKFNNLYYSGLVSDDSVNSTTHFNGTMNSYWSNCKYVRKRPRGLGLESIKLVQIKCLGVYTM